MATPKSPRHNQGREDIMEALNCEWTDVKFQFGDQSLKQIRAELDKMFWSETDVNGTLAQEIFDELN